MQPALDGNGWQWQQQRDHQRDGQAAQDIRGGDVAPQQHPHQGQPAQHPSSQQEFLHGVSTAEMYWSLSMTSPAARAANPKMGPANTVRARPTAMSAPVGINIP